MEGKLIGAGRVKRCSVERLAGCRDPRVCCDWQASRDEIVREVERSAGLERVNTIDLETADDAVPHPRLNIDQFSSADRKLIGSSNSEMLFVIIRRDNL